MPDDYEQLAVWPGTTLGNDTPGFFEKYMMEEFGIRAWFSDEIKGHDGHAYLFFFVHNEDIMKFAWKRLQYGIRWWEDVIGNGGGPNFPEWVLEKYPVRW